MIALHAEPVLMSVRLKRFLQVIFTKLIRIYAPTAAHVQMSARLKQFIQLTSFTV